MRLVLLAGNNKRNKDWILQVERTLAQFFDSSNILEYDHWKTGKELIDIQLEAKKLAALKQEDFAIFAKSAGCFVALEAIIDARSSTAAESSAANPCGAASTEVIS